MFSKKSRSAVVLSLLLLGASQVHAAAIDVSQYSITSIDAPNSEGSFGDSIVTDIQVPNTLLIQEGVHQFGQQEPARILAGAVLRFFTCPGNTTSPQSMNRHGAIVGWCHTWATEHVEGYYRSESTAWTVLRYPGAILTEALGVNDAHQVVGAYIDIQGVCHGFLWQRATNRYVTLDVPFPGATCTVPMAINNLGEIVGSYHNPLGQVHGFRRSSSGQWTSVDVPDTFFTMLADVNDAGDVVGAINTWRGTESIVIQHGVIKTFQLPIPGVFFTDLTAISNQGHLVGRYQIDITPTWNGEGDPPPVATLEQNFVATPLVKLGPDGKPLTSPQPVTASVARVARRSETKQVGPPLMLTGCPGDPITPGHVRPTRLAQSWVQCQQGKKR